MKGKLPHGFLVLCTLVTIAAVMGGCAAPTAAPPAATSAPAAPTSAPAAATSAPAPAGVNLTFVVWSYGLDVIQDNIKNFQAANPGVTVKLQDFSWLDYHDTIVGRFTANTPTDVLYSSDHWLQEWASAGWLEPLDTHFPEVTGYVQEMAPYAQQGVTYNGHIYGLPYYADTLIFVYNSDQLTKAGFDHPPATWDELTAQAKAIKAKGICTYPMIMAFSQQEGASIEAFTGMVYSRASGPGSMFDAKNNPTFNTPNGPMAQTIDWLHSALEVDKILDPASLTTAEIDQVKSMQAGAHTFTIFPSYNLAELNKPASSNYAGKFKMAMMPGTSHATEGYVRFYALSSQAVTRGPDVLSAAWKFLNYFGGKTNGQYVVVKRWAVQNGLGFGQLPLWGDADVQKAFNAWGDSTLLQQQAKLAWVKEGLTPFWGTWDVFTRAELQKAYLGQESTAAALNAIEAKWKELKGS
jgi:multiple sugar transport system substrate-binding protein